MLIQQKLENVDYFSFKEFYIIEIEKELRELNSNKATTFRNIPTKILKQSSKSCSDTLQKLFNDALRDSYFPDQLKCADVTSVFKKNEFFFERLMHKQTSFYIDQFLSPYTCGYTKGFSTQHALFSLIEKRKKALDNTGYVFNTVNRDLLMAKLHV